ncbi:MAG: type II toxin-antitoxin system PemK/MazF family toxin [Verrucomicrobia bacterium]|nr:type II toxin-antitoxin system PemK/MazF family toxin [Verrucomicrobiota bacterium]
MARSEVTRGDIWLVDLGLAQKIRPAVILSVAYLEHERALITYVPRTTSLRDTRFEVPHQARGFEPGAFDAQSIGTMPAAKLVRHITSLDAGTLAKVEDVVRSWLAL